MNCLSLILGPVPHWEAPLWKKWLLFAVLLVVVVAVDHFISRPRISARDVILFGASALLILGIAIALK